MTYIWSSESIIKPMCRVGFSKWKWCSWSTMDSLSMFRLWLRTRNGVTEMQIELKHVYTFLNCFLYVISLDWHQRSIQVRVLSTSDWTCKCNLVCFFPRKSKWFYLQMFSVMMSNYSQLDSKLYINHFLNIFLKMPTFEYQCRNCKRFLRDFMPALIDQRDRRVSLLNF